MLRAWTIKTDNCWKVSHNAYFNDQAKNVKNLVKKMGRDRDPGVKRSRMAGLRRKKGGKAGFENPYCGPSLT